MQRVPIVVLVCLRAFGLASAATAAAKQNPMFGSTKPTTRIVELLTGLKEQCEADAKAEETLYEKFVCWGKQVIKQKKETNEIAAEEISELEQYISDLDSGRIELTTERVDLEKEIAELTSSIETATAQREKENTDFKNAEAEMTDAIEALTKALEVLKTATDDHKTGVLAEVKAKVGQRAEQAAKEASVLQHAVTLGDRFLGKGDAFFLRRTLLGEVPTADWKKLNRKATFKMSYKARSFKIQDVLTELLDTFERSKSDAIAKEEEAVAMFDKLKGEKTGQLDSAREALSKMDKENGAKTLSKTDAQDRIDLLTEQVANDEKYIKQVVGELDYKKKDYEERVALRLGEIEAISKAIEILHNDDARDLFKKSFESQGYLFLQTGRAGRRAVQRDAAAVLRSAAKQTHDKRLLALADDLQKAPAFGKLADKFTPILTAIDGVIAALEAEAISDTDKKELCENTRAANTKEAIDLSRDIDENTDTMTRLTSEMEKLAMLIKENKDAIEVLKEQAKQAKAQRTEENEEYLKAKADDEEAAKTVQSAYDVLETFYKDEGLMLLQQRRSRAPVNVQAGKAPPPPPATWEDPYGGKTAESTGVLAILEMVKEDIKRDISKADEAETKAQETYDSLIADIDAEKGTREADINKMDQESAAKLGEFGDEELARGVSKTGLDDLLKSIKELEPGCDYYTINYPVRVKNRQIETDGLLKAKAILQGGEFSLAQQERLAPVSAHQ